MNLTPLVPLHGRTGSEPDPVLDGPRFATTCSATDNAGNGRTVPLHYTVTTTCANDGYGSTQLQWCVQICESGLTGKPLEDWIKRWFTRYRNYPYCVAP